MAATDPTNFTREQIEALGGVISGNVGKAKVLTTDDYNYPTNNPDGVALWTLGPGMYYNGNNVKMYTDSGNSYTISSTNIITVSGNDADIATTNYNSTSTDIRRVNTSNGSLSSVRTVLSTDNVINNLTSTSSTKPLSAMQGKVLKDLVDSLAIRAAGAPTTSTVGTVGQLLEDTTNGKLYICTDATNPYVWEEVGAGGGSGPTVAQTPGTSTTDVMSQNATTSLVYADPATRTKIKIGDGAYNNEGTDGVEIGHNAKVTSSYAVALGSGTEAKGVESVALGYVAEAAANGVSLGGHSKANAQNAVAFQYSLASTQGEVAFGMASWGANGGYNNSQYRLLTGLYDPQSAHDAVNKEYVDPTTDSSAPTTATVGRLGQIQIDTTTATAYMCVAVDTVTPAYTWKQITA